MSAAGGHHMRVRASGGHHMHTETSFNARDVAKLLLSSEDVRDRTLFWTLLSRTTAPSVLAKYGSCPSGPPSAAL